MASFVRYDNEREVLAVPLGVVGVWTSVDLSSYLDDTDAIGVLLRTRHLGGAEVPVFNIREVGAAEGPTAQSVTGIYGDFAIGFGGSGNSIEWWENQLAPTHKLFVIGEIHSPDVKLHDGAVDVTPLIGGTWTDHTPTLIGGDSLGDIAAVIHRVRDGGDVGLTDTIGLRKKGSTDPTHDSAGNQGLDWYITGLDENGYYQNYTSFKFDLPQNYFCEIGYILKTGDVVTIDEPSAEGLAAQSPDFGVLDLSGTVPADAFIAGGRWGQPSTTQSLNAFLRATGATEFGNMGRPATSIGGQSVSLNANLEAEYIVQAAPDTSRADFYVQWYEAPPVAPDPQTRSVTSVIASSDAVVVTGILGGVIRSVTSVIASSDAVVVTGILGGVIRSVASAIASSDAVVVTGILGGVIRGVATVITSSNAPFVETAGGVPSILGLAIGTAEVSAAVAGTAEAYAAVAGTAEASAARKV